MSWTKTSKGCYTNSEGDKWTKTSEHTWTNWKGETWTDTGNGHWVSSCWDNSSEQEPIPFMFEDDEDSNW